LLFSPAHCMPAGVLEPWPLHHRPQQPRRQRISPPRRTMGWWHLESQCTRTFRRRPSAAICCCSSSRRPSPAGTRATGSRSTRASPATQSPVDVVAGRSLGGQPVDDAKHRAAPLPRRILHGGQQLAEPGEHADCPLSQVSRHHRDASPLQYKTRMCYTYSWWQRIGFAVWVLTGACAI
jgi:hypothetical protein